MLIYSRKKSQRCKGSHIVYESKEEALKNGVKVVKTTTDNLNKGDWFQYKDGRVAQIVDKVVIKERYRDSVFFYTVLNIFTRTHGQTHSYFSSLYTLIPDEIDLESVDSDKISFLEDWLFNGLSLSECVVKYFKKWIPLWATKTTGVKHISLTNKNGERNYFYRALGYYILSGSWFDTVLKENRVIRDRYMGLVNAFEKAGMDDAYVAQKIKDFIESENPKKSVPALTMLVDILREYEEKKKKVDFVSNSFIEEAQELSKPQLPQPSINIEIPKMKEQEKEISDLLEEVEEEHDKHSDFS